jgi:HSP20 family protein
MATALTTPRPRPLGAWFRRGPLGALRREMEELFSDYLTDGGEGYLDRMAPSLDLSETPQAVEVRMDLPGVKPEDIEVQVSGNMLTISGQRKEEREEKSRTYHCVERMCGSFARTVTLPCAVKEDKVNAQYHDGVLTVSMPKTEESKARKIKIAT